jgi:hypothetical protein
MPRKWNTAVNTIGIDPDKNTMHLLPRPLAKGERRGKSRLAFPSLGALFS